MARPKAQQRRRRLCIVHGERCRWAGGDGSFEDGVSRLLAEMGEPATFDESHRCREATERDRSLGLGTFAPPGTPPIDPAVTRLAEELREEDR